MSHDGNDSTPDHTDVASGTVFWLKRNTDRPLEVEVLDGLVQGRRRFRSRLGEFAPWNDSSVEPEALREWYRDRVEAPPETHAMTRRRLRNLRGGLQSMCRLKSKDYSDDVSGDRALILAATAYVRDALGRGTPSREGDTTAKVPLSADERRLQRHEKSVRLWAKDMENWYSDTPNHKDGTELAYRVGVGGELSLSVRAWNILENNGLNTLGEIKALSLQGLLRLKHAGPKTAAEIDATVRHFGHQLTEDEAPR